MGALAGEADHRAVDVGADGAVGGGGAGGGIDADEQVGPGGGEVEGDVLQPAWAMGTRLSAGWAGAAAPG